MRKLFFVGMLLVGLFCGTSALLAKEDGTEDCDAVALEKVLAQARGILASTDFLFLRALKPEFDDTKNFVESMVAEQNREWAENSRKQEEAFVEGKKEYEAALNRYWGGGETVCPNQKMTDHNILNFIFRLFGESPMRRP